MRDLLKRLGKHYLYLIVGVALVFGIGYLNQDDVAKPRWLAATVGFIDSAIEELAHQVTWYSSVPDCGDDEARGLALKITRDLIADNRARVLAAPIQLGSIVSHGQDDAGVWNCWAELRLPGSGGSVKSRSVGEITYSIAADAADPAYFVVRVTLDRLEP